MKLPCGIIRDILPLYHDGVCGDESNAAVIEHLSECASCRAFYSNMCSADIIEAKAFDRASSERVANSYKKVRGKRAKKIAWIVLAAVLIHIAVGVLTALFASGCMIADAVFAKPDVHTDIEDYYLYTDISENDGHRFRLVDESIWPESITDEMSVVEFKLVHYDPWDPQYLGYMVVDYDEEAYHEEMTRLKFQRQMDYIGYYGSTAFSKYEVAAMYADESGHGLVYALTDGRGRVIYVLAEICNFFFDLEYEDYIPAEYLPEGFNAHQNNPYIDEWFEKVFGQRRSHII